ncbi:uncharacterized protein LOC122511117 isoform X2 [Leptopilina heterotoma]|uniref:uncharacterized protein LOC122511117 isoform X2 n=1 Tax=Leptopilina heterotoma TaxID=63436 RepID=UPI001CA9DF9B|nr:uncharacterized protein LOC122511117 isoform X2 [Leptopilina heterotoma]
MHFVTKWIIFFAINNVFALENEPSIDDIKHLEKALHVALKHMKQEAKYEDVAICIGLTRSGKSTLINYLIGNKLIGERVSLFKPVALKKADQSPGPEIGIGSTSETMIPTRWLSKNFPTLTIWDAPGFDDNRGPIQDITNAFYIYQLLQNVKSLKIILVVDFNDILNDNIRPFLTVLSSVENLLKKNIKNSYSSMALIFTKVPDYLNTSPIDFNFINDLLTEQILTTSIHMSVASRNFVQFLIENNQNIGLFKRAKVGPITTEMVDNGIFTAIQNTTTINEQLLRNVYPSISEASTIFLFQIREKLSSMEIFVNLQNTLRIVLDQKLETYDDINKSGALKTKLNGIIKELTTIRDRINKALVPGINFSAKIEILQTIDIQIEKLITDNNLIEKSNLMEFVDKLLDLKESNQFSISLEGVLLTANTKVGELITAVQLKLGEITQQEYSEKLESERKKFEEERRKLNEQMKQKQQRKKRRWNIWRFFG